MPGAESGWLDICFLPGAGQKVYFGDPLHTLRPVSGFKVRLPKGDYGLQAKVIAYGHDIRVSRLRLLRNGAMPRLSRKAGEVRTDSATILILDHQALARRIRTEAEEFKNRVIH